MLKENSMQEEWQISSGETELLEQMQEDWYSLYNEEEIFDYKQRWDYEQVLANPTPFLDEIAKLKVIPSYRYVINYIFRTVGLALGRENQIGFVKFVKEGKFPQKIDADWEEKCRKLLACESKEDEKIFEYDDFCILWQVLTVRLDTLFYQNGYREKKNWKKYFVELLELFDYKKLKGLALGLHMSLEHFEIFLRKVLKRSGVNFFNWDEILVYLTLRYAEKYGEWAYYPAYEKLQNMYPEYVVNEKEIEKADEINLEEAASTIYLQTKKVDVYVDSELFEKINPELKASLEYIARQNYRLQKKQITRTAMKRFHELWNGYLAKWQDEEVMEEIIKEEKKARAKSKGNGEVEKHVKKLKVLYEPDEDVVFQKGMIFEAESPQLSKKEMQKVILQVTKDTVLPAVKSEQVEVKVKAKMTQKEFTKNLPSLRCLFQEKKGNKGEDAVQFVQQTFFEDTNVFSKLKVDSKEYEELITDIKIGKRVRFYENTEKPNCGTLLMTCKQGTFIPKGTLFSFVADGVRFEYESTEDANVCTFDIPVQPCMKWKVEEGTTLTVEGISEIREAKSKGDFSRFGGGKIIVTANRKVNIPKGSVFILTTEDNQKIRYCAKKDKVINGDEQEFEKELDVIPEEKSGIKEKDGIKNNESLEIVATEKQQPQGLCGAIAGAQKLKLFQGVQEQCYVTVICQKTCEIPKGTKFKYEYQNHTFLFETTEAVKKSNCVNATIDVEWINKEECEACILKKEGRREVLPHNTYFLHNFKNVHEICTEYPITLDYSNKEKEDYKVKDRLLLRHIYQPTDEKHAGEIGYYEGFPEYGPEYLLNSSMFKSTRILDGTLNEKKPLENGEKLRNLILTLKFLEFVWWKEDETAGYDTMYAIDDIADFILMSDKEMNVCGFEPFNRSFAYDAFLALLLTSDDPLALFQAIWSDERILRKK